MTQPGPPDDVPPDGPLVESQPVDERRLVRLQQAAVLILYRAEGHTPLERQWAQQVLDLTVALRQARARLAELDDSEAGGQPDDP
ncbi:MAG TPA: hypothetical protein VK277_16445 [Acidimicrobiales bacterium]|nr:hypothetical protein [Acidimicrobiales bacterium]